MTFRQLEYFTALADTLNFTRAAEKCFVSQTAMTQQIQALEQSVGAQLFVRDKHHVSLTPAGLAYLTEARDILARADTAASLARTIALGEGGSLTVGYMCGSENTGLPRLFHAFHRAFPDITLHPVRDNMMNLCRRLEEGSCDAVFCLTPFMTTMPGMEQHPVRDYPVHAVLHADHPLAGSESLRYVDLRDERFIITQPRDRAFEEAEEQLLCRSRGGFAPNIVRSEEEIESVLMLVAAGIGICLMPSYAVKESDFGGLLRSIPLRSERGGQELLPFELAVRPDTANPAVRTFIAWMDSSGIVI